VSDNMTFGLRIAKADPAAIKRRVGEAAEILQLEPYLDRLPKALSGGQRQRVAIGRAIVRNPKVFLFDEPLSNLDAALRVATRIEIAKLHESMPGSTMIYVTHDQVEAMTLADRIVVLSAGNIEQVGSPLELYDNPRNLFVAQFIGSPAMNIVPAKITKSGTKTAVELPDGHKVIAPVKSAKALEGKSATFGIRPEDLSIATGNTKPVLQGQVSLVESLGEVTMVYVDVAGRDEPLIAKIAGTQSFERGSNIKLTAEPEKMHVFNADGISLRHIGSQKESVSY
ncbi:MAG: ABC transporter ATP-binding protein, partial [Rhizobiaceae bacterium]